MVTVVVTAKAVWESTLTEVKSLGKLQLSCLQKYNNFRKFIEKVFIVNTFTRRYFVMRIFFLRIRDLNIKIVIINYAVRILCECVYN